MFGTDRNARCSSSGVVRAVRRVILSPLKKGTLLIINGEMIFTIGANIAILSGSRRSGRASTALTAFVREVFENHVFIAL